MGENTLKQLIIGISGKSKSGKDSTAKHLKAKIGKACKIYSFADKLKRDVCMNLLGLTYEQCYTEEGKNSLTHLRWEDMPGVVTPKIVAQNEKLDNCFSEEFESIGLIPKSEGQMLAREVLQFVGTDIFRKMYSKVWVDALIRQIQKDRPTVAILADVRFLDEAVGLKRIGAKLWRLTRNPEDMQHKSETDLDDYVEWDLLLDNEEMTLERQNDWAWKEYCDISPFEESPYENI